MTKRKLYDVAEALKEIRAQGFKHVRLTEVDGTPVISYNIVAKPVEPKLKEIEKRWKSLPDGVYLIEAKSVYGSKTRAFPYYVAKGKNEDFVLPEFVSEPKPSTNGKGKLQEVNVLSYEEALKVNTQLAELQMKVAALEKEKKELEEELASQDMGEDEDELQEPAFDWGGKISNWLEQIGPIAGPIADRYFNLQEKRLQFEQAKFLSQNGYPLTGPKNGNGRASKTRQPGVEDVPQPGTPDWPKYLQWVMALDDDSFNQHLDELKAYDAELYAQVEAEVLEDEGGAGE